MVKNGRIEEEHHKQAFEIYYGEGLKRSYRIVAKRFGVSAGTIKNWARWFHWRDRIAERDAEITKRVVNETFEQGVEERARNLKIVQAALMRAAKDIAEGKVRVRMGDLELLMKLEERLLGVPRTLDARETSRPGGVTIYLPENERGDPYRTDPAPE